MAIRSFSSASISTGAKSSKFRDSQVSEGDYYWIASFNGGSLSTAEFANIPQTYKHLEVRVYARTNIVSSVDNANLNFNSDSGANYSQQQMYGSDGTSVGASNNGTSGQSTPAFFNVSGASAPTYMYGTGIAQIADYTNSTTWKTAYTVTGSEHNTTGSFLIHRMITWQNTAPITNIKFTFTGTLDSNSRIDLFGIRG
jgi:hypothetical protein